MKEKHVRKKCVKVWERGNTLGLGNGVRSYELGLPELYIMRRRTANARGLLPGGCSADLDT